MRSPVQKMCPGSACPFRLPTVGGSSDWWLSQPDLILEWNSSRTHRLHHPRRLANTRQTCSRVFLLIRAAFPRSPRKRTVEVHSAHGSVPGRPPEKKEVIYYGPAGWTMTGTRTVSTATKATSGGYTTKTEVVEVWRSNMFSGTQWWTWDRISGLQSTIHVPQNNE